MKKEEKEWNPSALRLMEALNGVDEDLLERSEHQKTSKVVAFTGKYGKLCAACACLAILGSAWFAMTRTGVVSPYKGYETAQDAEYVSETTGKSMHEEACEEACEENAVEESETIAADSYGLNVLLDGYQPVENDMMTTEEAGKYAYTSRSWTNGSYMDAGDTNGGDTNVGYMNESDMVTIRIYDIAGSTAEDFDTLVTSEMLEEEFGYKIVSREFLKEQSQAAELTDSDIEEIIASGDCFGVLFEDGKLVEVTGQISAEQFRNWVEQL